MTVKEAISTAKATLPNIESISKEVLRFFAKELNCNTAKLIAFDETEVNVERLGYFLKKRGENTPFEYIINEADFYGELFYVDERVLIPRPETEILLEYAVKIAKEISAKSLLDICTGSGIVAVCAKKQIPHLVVAASDISKKALEVTSINKTKHNVEISLIESDLFESPQTKGFELITANPPYIQNGYPLEPHVLKEPHNALFGGKRGDEIVKRILEAFFSKDHKAIVCEIGYDQKNYVLDTINGKKSIKYGFYKDYSGFDRGFWIIKD